MYIYIYIIYLNLIYTHCDTLYMSCSYTNRERERTVCISLWALQRWSCVSSASLTVPDDLGISGERILLLAMAETTTKSLCEAKMARRLCFTLQSRDVFNLCNCYWRQEQKQTSLSLPKDGHHCLLQFATLASTLPASESKMVQPKVKEQTLVRYPCC